MRPRCPGSSPDAGLCFRAAGADAAVRIEADCDAASDVAAGDHAEVDPATDNPEEDRAATDHQAEDRAEEVGDSECEHARSGAAASSETSRADSSACATNCEPDRGPTARAHDSGASRSKSNADADNQPEGDRATGSGKDVVANEGVPGSGTTNSSPPDDRASRAGVPLERLVREAARSKDQPQDDRPAADCEEQTTNSSGHTARRRDS